MSNKETEEQENTVQETTKKEVATEEKEGEKFSKVPEAKAIGNERITILKHNLSATSIDERGGIHPASVELAIRNVSDSSFATVLFEAVFYDIEGNVLDTVKHSEIDLKPSFSRAVNINSLTPYHDNIKSYAIRITRTTTAEVEKVQLRRHEIRTTDTGEEEVRGIVKNISSVKTDVALIATFLDFKKENISIRVVILRDIEPNNTKQFHFLFKPMEGDRVGTYTLDIGDIVE
ncbi:hypothetical protein ACFLY3_05010 [Chloroflexota bacterium]